jgi:chemotaxis protein MotB
MPEEAAVIFELQRRLEHSERGRMSLKRKLARKSVEEDGFAWGLADMMTLLLVFFILIYAQAISQQAAAKSEESSVAASAPKLGLSWRPIFVWAKNPAGGGVETDHAAEGHVTSPPAEAEPARQAALVQTDQTGRTDPKPSRPAEPAAVQPANQTHTASAVTSQRDSEPPKSVATQRRLEAMKQQMLGQVDRAQVGDVSARVEENRLVFTLGERVTFNAGQADLLPGFVPTLRRLAGVIADQPQYRVRVSGHTDDRPIQTIRFPSNWELSAARAVAVARVLMANGLVDPGRVTIEGRASYEPVAPNDTPERRRANRRVEISLERIAR